MAKKKRRSKRDSDVTKVTRRITTITEDDPFAKLGIYARTGKGKTRLAASFPKCLILRLPGEGTRSAKEFKSTRIFSIKEWDDFGAVYWYLARGEHPFLTVCIDTATQMNVLALRHAMKENAERDPAKDPKQPRRQDWGKAAELMKDMLMRFRNLPMHVVFIAQERTTGDPEEGEEIVHTPDLPAGSRGTFLASVGIVGRIYQKEIREKGKAGKKRRTKWVTCMLVGPHEEYETKDQTGVLGRIVVNPTGDKIIKAWETSPPE